MSEAASPATCAEVAPRSPAGPKKRPRHGYPDLSRAANTRNGDEQTRKQLRVEAAIYRRLRMAPRQEGAPHWGYPPPRQAGVDWTDTIHLYLIGPRVSDGTLKVGISSNIKRRLSQLNAANPHGLQVVQLFDVRRVMAVQTEHRIHGRLAASLISGEWFRIGREEAAAVIEDEIGRVSEALGAYAVAAEALIGEYDLA